MRILLVEDDPLQAESILASLKAHFAEIGIHHLSTEQEFRAKLDEIAASPPDLVILDVMLRWTDPSPEMEVPPEEVRREKHYRAGLRCQRLLSERMGDNCPPILLYTILETEDVGILPQGVEHLSKSSDLKPLVKRIKELQQRQAPRASSR